MAIEFDGKTLETSPMGYLINIEDWSKELAEQIAAEESVTLTDKHWDLINYLREEFIGNAGNQPNTRSMVKTMGKLWDNKKMKAKDLYDLFPGEPSKQGGKIAGLPESRRKGGY